VVRDVSKLREVVEKLEKPDIARSVIFDLLKGLHVSAIEGFVLTSGDGLIRDRLELYLMELRHLRPLLNGDDLMALGVPQGEVIGKLLGEILNARLDGSLSSRRDEKNYVLEALLYE